MLGTSEWWRVSVKCGEVREWWGVEDECVMLQGFWSSFEDRVQKASVQNVSATQIVRLGKGPV